MLKNKLWLSLFSSCPGRGTATKSCKVASWMMEFRWRSASSQCKLMTWPTYQPESFRDSQFKKSQDIWRCFNGRSNSTDTFQYWVATFPQKRKKKTRNLQPPEIPSGWIIHQLGFLSKKDSAPLPFLATKLCRCRLVLGHQGLLHGFGHQGLLHPWPWLERFGSRITPGVFRIIFHVFGEDLKCFSTKYFHKQLQQKNHSGTFSWQGVQVISSGIVPQFRCQS